MLGQSKTAFQAEIDAACETIDFWRFNPHYAQCLYDEQPISDHTMWNQIDYRPLEGFVYAVTPFNFTAIGGNLPTAPALMGNTVIWKPASSAMLSRTASSPAEACLPPGVVPLIPGDAAGPGVASTSRPVACTSRASRRSSTAFAAIGRTCRLPVVPAHRGETAQDFIFPLFGRPPRPPPCPSPGGF